MVSQISQESAIALDDIQSAADKASVVAASSSDNAKILGVLAVATAPTIVGSWLFGAFAVDQAHDKSGRLLKLSERCLYSS